MDRETLIETIKEWIEVEKEVKELTSILKDRRQRKRNLTAVLVEIMKNNDIDEFDVNSGKLVYTKNKVKSSLSKKHLISSLGDYFKDNPELALEVTQHILDARTEKIKETIKQK